MSKYNWPPESDSESLTILLDCWRSCTANALEVLRNSYSLARIVEEARAMPLPHSDWYVIWTGLEFDVYREMNRGVTVFSVDNDENLIAPCPDQLRRFLVKGCNWGILDKQVYRPLMYSKDRFYNAASQIGL